MPLNYPHDFPCLRDPVQKTALFCGAGLSFDLVPVTEELFHEKRTSAEAELHVTGNGANLYEWADSVIQELEVRGETAPKLSLAKALGITIDPRWTGLASTDFRESKPRHRVIARLAKEGRWTAIWSFNWDCHIENALEDVGLERGTPRFRSPWEKTAYRTHITNDDIPGCGHADIVAVRKPHGCVYALLEAEKCQSTDTPRCEELSSRFMIRKTELEHRPTNATDDHFFAHFDVDVAANPTIITAWSVSELTLRNALVKSREGMQEGRISVIDCEFQPTHLEVCNAFIATKANSYFYIPRNSTPPTLDDLFLWVQALYGFSRIRELVVQPIQEILDRWKNTIQNPDTPTFISYFFHEFLPVWVRLCWTSDLIECHGFKPHEINLDRPYIHVSWSTPNVNRLDLITAGFILSGLPDGGGAWDVKTFPGCFWNPTSQQLVVPLPCWGKPNYLRALQPLVKAIQREIGYVRKLSVFPVTEDGQPGNPVLVKQMTQNLVDLIRVPSIASIENISVVTDLKGDG